MTDRELLELAAKAAGLWDAENNCIDIPWGPLVSDGDAFRLAVKLGIDVQQFCGSGMVEAWKHPHQAIGVDYGDDPYAATRRAIVRAAAEIGKAMR